MSRKAATIEHLEKLVEWSGGVQEFCRRTGVKSSNLKAYLNGSKRVSWKWIMLRTTKVFSLPPAFVPSLEGMKLEKKTLKKSELENVQGVYALFDSAMRVIYFGKALKLRTEINQTLSRHVAEVRPWNGKKDLKFHAITAYISAYRIERGDSVFRHDVEALVLRLFVNNTFNKKGAKFKRSN